MPAPPAEPPAYGGYAAPVGGFAPADSVGDVESLHEFASLPVAPQFDAPAPTTQAFAPAAFAPPADTQPVFSPMQPEAFAAPQPEAAYPPPVFAPAEDQLPPLPPAQDDEGLLAEPSKKKERKGVDKRLLAGALVVVVAGGGYFGYTQLTKKSSSTTANTPIVPVTAPVVHYDFPSNVAGLKLQSAASSASMRGVVLGQVKAFNPALAKSLSFASYSAGQPSIIVMAFHPGAAKLATDYSALVKYSATPDAGNVATAPHAATPGAAGGQMTCGGESGSQPYSWCVWQGTSTVGVMQISGSPKSQITEILTREMRAYAEH
jgi:hypothetical protein